MESLQSQVDRHTLGGLTIFYVCPFLMFESIGVFVLLLIAYVVYKDAQTQGMDPLLWAVVVFFIPLLGLTLYILRREHRI